jgi:fructokinase
MAGDCPHVVAIGELLWDIFPDGERLGGAPSNFLVHAAGLGGEGSLISAVGADDRGDNALLRLGMRGVDLSGVSCVPDAPTGTVGISLASGQPTYTIQENTAWDEIPWTRSAHDLAESADIACWGTICQRSPLSRSTHYAFFNALPSRCLRILDCNFRQHYHDQETIVRSLRSADVVKLNSEEVNQMTTYADATLEKMLSDYDLDLIVVTDGDAGCRVVEPDGRTTEVPVDEVLVADTVGCGDAFTAGFALSLHDGMDPVDAALYANGIGAYVATQQGGMPELPEDYAIWV